MLTPKNPPSRRSRKNRLLDLAKQQLQQSEGTHKEAHSFQIGKFRSKRKRVGAGLTFTSSTSSTKTPRKASPDTSPRPFPWKRAGKKQGENRKKKKKKSKTKEEKTPTVQSSSITIDLISDSEEENEPENSRMKTRSFGDRAKFAAYHVFVGSKSYSETARVEYFRDEIMVKFQRDRFTIKYKNILEYIVNQLAPPFCITIRAKGIDKDDYDPESSKADKRYSSLFLEGSKISNTEYESVAKNIKNVHLQPHRIEAQEMSQLQLRKCGLNKKRLALAKKSDDEIVEIVAKYTPADSVETITVTEKDVDRLAPGEFLNDTLIDFYLRYMSDNILKSVQRKRCHIFSSFFFTKYRDSDPEDRYESVRKWTKDIDIFKKNFLLVPINESLHWSLAIICYPKLIFNPPRKNKEKRNKPCILYLDSLMRKRGAVGHCKLLRAYLAQEAKVKQNIEMKVASGNLPLHFMKVPQQKNSSDCGVFLLQYAENFCKEPLAYDAKKGECTEWFDSKGVRNKRKAIRDLLDEMRGENL